MHNYGIDSNNHEDDSTVLMASRSHKKHEDSEGVWLISYSDMMTLLMGFFALMLSMSEIDPKKSAAIQKEASEYFGGKFQKPLENLHTELREKIKQARLENQIQIEEEPNGLAMIFTGTLLFDSGSVALKDEGVAVFDQIIPIIRKAAPEYFIVSEGHTDNKPIATPIIPSNWELSGLRASTVARKFESFGFAKEKLTIIGWGETRPLAPNSDSNGTVNTINQSRNRRVVIRILKDKIL
ncbi:MAG TPA: flagellar motor protein MotB [Pseudobdellovibrionaceae bacterium]|jgi:chemotaxis protein MotB|nr:flagellar motor protein MotB [Pseudobdellovibrionaceae bacterium]